MPINNIENLKPFLKDDADINAFQNIINSEFTVDESWLQSAETKGDTIVVPYISKRVDKALKSFQTQTMAPEIERQVNERLQKQEKETAIERQIRLMREENDARDKKYELEKHKNEALKYAYEKGLDDVGFEYIKLGNDIAETKLNIDRMVKYFDIKVVEGVEDKFAEGGRKIKSRDNNFQNNTLTYEDIKAMTPEERRKNADRIKKWNDEQLLKNKF